MSVGPHIANALLLFGLLRRMTGALWRSALVAALFALHPLHVESVAWASERKDVLSTLFFLLTLWAYAAYAEGRRPEARPGRARRPAANYLLALGCFALGLMSKPMLVTLPFVLLLLDYWPLQRWPRRAPAAQPDTATGRPRLGLFSLLLEKAPFFALAAASSIVTYFVQRHGGAVSTSLTFGERVANALISYARYIGKTFWPLDLSILYPHPGRWPLGAGVGAAVLLLACAIGLINGLGIVFLGLSPIVMTLATNGLLQGAALLYSNGTPDGFSSPMLRWFMTGKIWVFAPVTIFMVAFVFAAVTLLGRTPFGRRVYGLSLIHL